MPSRQDDGDARSDGLLAARTSWPDGALLICRDCGRREAKKLTKRLRRRLHAAGLRKIRPLLTSCQDVCPKRGAAVTVLVADAAVRTFVIRSAAEADALARSLVVEAER